MWDESPVEFGHNVSYMCQEGLYFEMDRDMIEFQVTCLETGSWDEPLFWPGCVQTVHCGPPPPKHELGIKCIKCIKCNKCNKCN